MLGKTVCINRLHCSVQEHELKHRFEWNTRMACCTRSACPGYQSAQFRIQVVEVYPIVYIKFDCLGLLFHFQQLHHLYPWAQKHTQLPLLCRKDKRCFLQGATPDKFRTDYKDAMEPDRLKKCCLQNSRSRMMHSDSNC